MYGDEFVFDLQRFESSGDSTTISEGNSVITKGGFYEIAQGFTGTITISTTDAVTIDGAVAGNLQEVFIKVDSKTADLTIKDLNILNSGSVTFGKGKNNKLTLSGTNILTCQYTVGDILIGGNANVEAICAINDGGVDGGGGTGIGNGYTSSPGSASTTGNITITDSAQVVAKNYGYGLGLGKGITESDNINTMGAITFSGGNVTIQNSGSAGSIEINGEIYSPEEKMVFVDGEFIADGNDARINQTSNKTVTGTKKSDLIYNYGSNVFINAKGGNDDIFNMSPDVTINAGNGNNFITSRDDNVSIKAGKGNDSINAFGMANTIDAGDGNNVIFNYQSEVSIKTGAGSDTVMHLGYGTNPNIEGVTVTGGEFDSTIDTGAGNDSIDNGASLVSINAGDGDDSIDTHSSFSMTDAGAGNDFIKISGGKNFTINAGKGDDFIENFWGHGENILFTYAQGDGRQRRDFWLCNVNGFFLSFAA